MCLVTEIADCAGKFAGCRKACQRQQYNIVYSPISQCRLDCQCAIVIVETLKRKIYRTSTFVAGSLMPSAEAVLVWPMRVRNINERCKKPLIATAVCLEQRESSSLAFIQLLIARVMDLKTLWC